MKKLTEENLVEIYDRIYKAENTLVHPKWGALGPYAGQSPRSTKHVKWLARNCPPPATVLDASCGRGSLLRKLISLGYEASGTEVVDYLLETDLKDLPVRILPYSRLKELGRGKFDVVISSDVLEHLPNEDAVLSAIKALKFISKKYVLISVGVIPGDKYPKALGILSEIKNLHTVVKPFCWWLKNIKRRLKVIRCRDGGATMFFFCEKK